MVYLPSVLWWNYMVNILHTCLLYSSYSAIHLLAVYKIYRLSTEKIERFKESEMF